MKKSKRILLVILILIVLLVVGGFLAYYFLSDKEDKNEVKVIKEIPAYGYVLNENETKLYKDTFEELDKVLSKDEVDYEEYAKYVAKLFIIDFYTLNNKLSKNDIGGTEFIKESMRDNFIEEARSTFYKYLEVKTDDRSQHLPEVSGIDEVKLENTTFTIYDKTTTTTTSKYKKVTASGTTVDAYKVTISWSYKEDLGYETKANMIIIKEDKKLYIVEMD